MTPRPYKSDAAEIQDFLAELESQSWLGYRRWWPRYAFHYNDVRNIASVLNCGFLYSRTTALSRQLLQVDCASPEVIALTPEVEQRWVRLYFRPRTPTQFRNEGVRPVGRRLMGGAHCPVPVFLLFSARELLAREGSHFTNGSLALLHDRGATASFLKQLNFRFIYHDSGFMPDLRDVIVNARHSEILVEEPLPLQHLRYIVCRSEAERLTLIALLDPATRDQWQDRIILESAGKLFEKKWAFIERVRLGPETCTIHFSPDITQGARGPYHFAFRLVGSSTSVMCDYEKSRFDVPASALGLDYENYIDHYEVTIEMDSDLVFKSAYADDQQIVT